MNPITYASNACRSARYRREKHAILPHRDGGRNSALQPSCQLPRPIAFGQRGTSHGHAQNAGLALAHVPNGTEGAGKGERRRESRTWQAPLLPAVHSGQNPAAKTAAGVISSRRAVPGDSIPTTSITRKWARGSGCALKCFVVAGSVGCGMVLPTGWSSRFNRLVADDSYCWHLTPEGVVMRFSCSGIFENSAGTCDARGVAASWSVAKDRLFAAGVAPSKGARP